MRSLHKEYSETTITINQNSIDVTSIEGNETTVILLSAPIKPPTEYLYFSLLSVEGEPITIEPDTPGMFNTTTIKGDQLFTLKIKLADFKVDELAVRVNSTERAVIEFLEVIRYNFTEYTVIESDGKTTLKSNHFIRFYDKNIDQIKVKVSFNDLNLVPVSYGFVRLSTDDTNYLPLASQFQEEYNITRKNLLNNEEIIVKNPFKDVKDNKKYLAFIFSIQRYESHEYSIEIGEISEGGGNTILIIILIIVGIIVVVGVIALIIFFIGKRKGGEGGSHEGNFGKFDDMEDDGNNHPLSPEQQ